MLPWLTTCIAAARIHGIDILDGVYNDIGNADGFVAECAQGVDFGFDGKTLIHPNQIEPCNKAFSPSAAEVEQARKTIAVFDLPENRPRVWSRKNRGSSDRTQCPFSISPSRKL